MLDFCASLYYIDNMINDMMEPELKDLACYTELKGYKLAVYKSHNTTHTIKIGLYPVWVKNKPKIASHCIVYYESPMNGEGDSEQVMRAIDKMRDYIKGIA